MICLNNRCKLVRLQFFDYITESQEAISANVFVDDLNEVKVEPENFQDSCRNPSKGNEVT